MTDSDRQRVSELFFQACDMEEPARSVFLDQACGDRADLKAQVLKLIAGGDATLQGGFTQQVEAALHSAAENFVDDNMLAPTSVGPFTILREIGEGGMSVVYEAEQHEPVRRNVALKVIRPGMDTREVIARFESERQALAVMDHTNIARIYDGGTTDAGRPYFVMELVQGVPITDYCDAHELSTRQRLELFLTVCAAVQHAHQKGMVHRDLKPSNILVAEEDGHAVAKVIDFGIAKAIDARGDNTPDLTRYGQLIGTPSYMSPEQADPTGLSIDTRTDVYSLGVVLYEMLVGALPFEVDASSGQTIQAAVTDTLTPRPSARFAALSSRQAAVARLRGTDPAGLKRMLASSLDWIVLKAMEKEPERRYQTVNALSTDIEHYLEFRPISAHPPSAGYVLSRFVRRHRTSVAVAGIVLFAMVGGVTLATVGFLRAIEAEKHAVREGNAALEVSKFLTDLFTTPDPARALGNTITAREILDRGVARIDTELTGQPEVRAKLMNTMALVYRNLGLFSEARPLFEQAMQARRGSGVGDSLELADTAQELAVLLQELNAHDDAIAVSEQALRIRRELAGPASPLVAQSLNTLGLSWYLQGDYDQAERYYRDAQTIYESLTPADDEGHAVNLNNLAGLYAKRGDYEKAETLFRRSLSMRRALYGEEHPKIATILNNLGLVRLQANDLDNAQLYFDQALAMRRKLLGNNHSEVGRTLNNLALLLRRRGDLVSAEPLYRESLKIRRDVFGESHPAIANGLNNLAGLLRAQGDLPGAEETYREALRLRRQISGDNVSDAAIIQTNLAIVLNEQGRYGEACGEASAALSVLQTSLGKEHWRPAVTASVLGACLTGQHRLEEAEPLLTESFPVIRGARGDDATYTREAAQRLVALYETWKRPDDARRYRALLAQAGNN